MIMDRTQCFRNWILFHHQVKEWKRYLLSWLGLKEGAVSSHCTGMYPLFREIENCGTPVHNLVNHIAFIMRCESKDIITKGLCVTFPVRLVA
jgi:hypothetical protein